MASVWSAPKAAAVEELGEWWEDLVDRSIGSRGLVLAVPAGWGRTTVLDRFAERVEQDQDRFGIVVRVRGAEAPSGAGLQSWWLRELVRQAGLSQRWKEVLGLDRPGGVFDLSASVAGLGLLSVPGQVAALLVGISLRKLTADRDESEAGVLDAVERLGWVVARQSSKVPVVVLIDDADRLDPGLMGRFVGSMISRRDGQCLLVVVADEDSDLERRLCGSGRFGPMRDRVVTVGVEADMGEMARRRLIECRAEEWPRAAVDRLAERTASFKDIWRVLSARAAADVAGRQDPAEQRDAVDRLVDEVLVRGPATLPAAVVAWVGGLMHRAQLDAVLGRLPAGASGGDWWEHDRWVVGFGPFVRLADTGAIGRASRAADSLLSSDDRRLVADEVVAGAVALTSAEGRDGPLDRVAWVSALRPVDHLTATGDVVVDLTVGSLLLLLVEQHEALGDVRSAYRCASTALTELDVTVSPAHKALSGRLIAARRRLRADATATDDADTARDEANDAALGVEARLWATISLLDHHDTRAAGVEAASALADDLDRYSDDLGRAGIRWRLLLAFHVGHAGRPSLSERLLRPIAADDAATEPADDTDDIIKELAAQVLVAVAGPQADLHVGRSLFQADYDHLPQDAEPEERLRIVAALADLNYRLGCYRSALRWGRETLALRTTLQHPEHPEVLLNRADVAFRTGDAGDAREALRLFQELLPDQTRVLGPDHPDTLTTRNNLAFWIGRAGDARGALRLFRELLPDRVRVLGADHAGVLITRNNVAFWTGEAGDARGALRLFQELLPDGVRVLGADHRDVLINRANVAFWTGETGDAQGALRVLQELLPDRVRVLGPDHPDVLGTRSLIAGLAGDTGTAEGALRLFHDLLPDHVRVLGADHQDVLRTRHSIAYWTGETGDAEGSLRLSRELLADQVRVLGAEHPDVLATQHNVAHCTGRRGDSEGALRLFQVQFSDRLRILGSDHPRLLITRSNVAYWTGQMGDTDGALRLLRVLLADQVRVLGPDHPDVLVTRNNIADLE